MKRESVRYARCENTHTNNIHAEMTLIALYLNIRTHSYKHTYIILNKYTHIHEYRNDVDHPLPKHTHTLIHAHVHNSKYTHTHIHTYINTEMTVIALYLNIRTHITHSYTHTCIHPNIHIHTSIQKRG